MTAARVALLQAEELQLGLDAVDDALAHVGGVVVVVVVVGSVRCLLAVVRDGQGCREAGRRSKRASEQASDRGRGWGWADGKSTQMLPHFVSTARGWYLRGWLQRRRSDWSGCSMRVCVSASGLGRRYGGEQRGRGGDLGKVDRGRQGKVGRWLAGWRVKTKVFGKVDGKSPGVSSRCRGNWGRGRRLGGGRE